MIFQKGKQQHGTDTVMARDIVHDFRRRACRPSRIFAVSLQPAGVLGDEASAADESFSQGLLEYPQYTRPAEFRGLKVLEVLLSGNHAAIAKWRAEQARLRTAQRRPDLL